MTLRARKQKLYEALQLVAKIVPRKTDLTILRNVVMEAKEGDNLTIWGTDLNRHLIVDVPSEGRGKMCLPLRALLALAKPDSKKDDEFIYFAAKDGGGISIATDSTATVKIDAKQGEIDDFPTLPKGKYKKVTAKRWTASVLKEKLSFILPAICQDGTRPRICCVAFTDKKMVTTDGHRLHVVDLPIDIKDGDTNPVLIPGKTAKVLDCFLTNSKEMVELARCEDSLRIKADNWTLYTELTDGDYPSYKQVIPAYQGSSITVDRDVYHIALERAQKLSRGLIVEFVVEDDKLVITSRDPEIGDTKTTIPLLAASMGGSYERKPMGFNASYMLDIIRKAPESEIEISFEAPLDSCLVKMRGTTKLAVVMPMRV